MFEQIVSLEEEMQTGMLDQLNATDRKELQLLTSELSEKREALLQQSVQRSKVFLQVAVASWKFANEIFDYPRRREKRKTSRILWRQIFSSASPILRRCLNRAKKTKACRSSREIDTSLNKQKLKYWNSRVNLQVQSNEALISSSYIRNYVRC